MNRPFEFPGIYGMDRLVLMTRDPWWIYAYWEIKPATERKALERVALEEAVGVKRVLRVYREANQNNFFDIEVGNFSDHWVVDVGLPDQAWVAEIGLRSLDGRFFALIRSNAARTPRYGLSAEIDPEWAMPDVLWSRLFEVCGVFQDSHSSSDLIREPS